MLDSPDGVAPLVVIALVVAFAVWTLVRTVKAAGEARALEDASSRGGANPSKDGDKGEAPVVKTGAKKKKKASKAGARRVSDEGVAPANVGAIENDEAGAKAAGSSSERLVAALGALRPLSEDEDDAEVTQVVVSPLTPAPGPAAAPVPPDSKPPQSPSTEGPPPIGDGERDSDEPPPDRPSKVEVIYEEEADIEEVTAPVGRILVSAWAQSDRGRVRKNNEDSLLVMPDQSVFSVADGMGGYKGGEIASALAAETLRGCFEKGVFDAKTESATPVPRRGLEVARAIQKANEAILARAKADASLSNMGTTVVAARFSVNKQRVYIGHVGDSRCYRIRHGAMRQLTTDHTMERLGLKGPGAEHLYQAVGIKPTMQIDMIVDKPRVGDTYLLCSDGLSKMATDEEIAELAQDADLEAGANALVELANQHGGRDNVTVILVRVAEHDVTAEDAADKGGAAESSSSAS